MTDLNFEKSLELRQVAPDIYENVHQPWTWFATGHVPGSVLMTLSAAAAWKTIPTDFTLDNLHAQFLSASNATLPYHYKVTRTSEGKRFITRNVLATQQSRPIIAVSLSFIKTTPWTGLSLHHSTPQTNKTRIAEITIDDLASTRSRLGPFMEFQRLPLLHQKPKEMHTSMQPVVAQIIGPLNAKPGTTLHALGILALSDYHVLDAPIHLAGHSIGLPAIGDNSGKVIESPLKLHTSLNHAVHFTGNIGWRADELTYVEVMSPWTNEGRGMVTSRIFDKEGGLVATCEQETFYVFRPDAKL